jgi:hypothetical protein
MQRSKTHSEYKKESKTWIAGPGRKRSNSPLENRQYNIPAVFRGIEKVLTFHARQR